VICIPGESAGTVGQWKLLLIKRQILDLRYETDHARLFAVARTASGGDSAQAVRVATARPVNQLVGGSVNLARSHGGKNRLRRDGSQSGKRASFHLRKSST